MPSPSIIIFASGRGSNAEAIIRYFDKENTAAVRLIVCNKPTAGVIDVARRYDIPVLLIDKNNFSAADTISHLRSYEPSLLVLAGFLWKVPEAIIHAFPDKIINIHPALLPKYGGRGMYGSRVHDAVKAAGDKESGITIHWVNERYDEGAIILQARCPVAATDDAGKIAANIHLLEHYYFPRVIEFLLSQQL